MLNSDRKATERILDEIRKHRQLQHGLGYSPTRDDTLESSELLSAALSYAELAKQQIANRNWHTVTSYPKTNWLTAGGTDVGYEVNSPKPPAQWPFGTHAWRPSAPRYNLVRAATLIVGELERLERLDKKFLEKPKKPKKNKKPKINDAYYTLSSLGTTTYNGPVTASAAHWPTPTTGYASGTTSSTQFLSPGTVRRLP